MIKLVVSDLDGTMFGKDCAVPPEAAALVQRLHENNILFTIASGRAEWMIEPIVQQLGIHCPYLACNGGTIIQNGIVLRRMQFPLCLVRKASEQADLLGHSVVYTINGEERVTLRTPWMEEDTRSGSKRNYDPVPFSEEEWNTLQIEKVMYFDPSRSGSIAEIDAIFSQHNKVAHVRYHNRSVEVTERSVNKATGLLALAQLMHLDIREILMIADDQNDIEALKLAGVGAAVANATSDAKAAANYICQGEQFSGIQEAVERFCFGEVTCI